MKFLVTLMLLNAQLVGASVTSIHKKYNVTCTYKQVFMNENEGTSNPQARINVSEFEETSIENHEKTKETVMWKLKRRSINGEELDVTNVNGVSVYTYNQLSEKERSVHYVDNSEYLDLEDKPQTDVYEIDYNFKLLSVEAGKKSEEMSYLNEGKIVRILRNKTMTDPKKITLDLFYLNPESLSNEYSKVIFAHRFCEYNEI